MRTREQWSHLVRCSVRGVTDEQADAIGHMCFEAVARGEERVNVWHQSSLYFGHACPCCVCNK
jgi:hypothetical protein